jgi:beta propeller repeat protein
MQEKTQIYLCNSCCIMSLSPRHSPRNDHTVVLRSRDSSVQRPLIIGLKQRHTAYSRGSPPDTPLPYRPRASISDSRFVTTNTKTIHDNTFAKSDLLVSWGIDSMLGRMVVRVLVFLLLCQPVYVAMGMEIEVEQVSPTEEGEESINTVDSDIDSGLENAVDTEGEGDDVLGENDSEASNNEGFVESEESDLENLDDDQVEDATQGDENLDTSDDEGAEESEDDDSLQTTEEGQGTEESFQSSTDTASSTDTVASSTNETVEPIVQTTTSAYTFDEGDCMLVSEGEFYCVASGPERQLMQGDESVYAEKDREGDREIYYFDGVEVIRITNNSYDDFAPMYDEETKRIVWQAMINDRLQILVHELTTNMTRQITSSRQNSSNPSILGDIVVWQEWVDTNWEIMMTDVDNDGQEFDVTRLTDNVVHDMFPAVYDDLITWQSERGSSWEVVVYDIQTQKRHTLEKSADNTKYENPRFVLLFDSKHDNGDVETIGYDLDSGEMMELGTKANPQPLSPVTPRDKVPEASISTSSTTMLKEGDSNNSEGGDGGEDLL